MKEAVVILEWGPTKVDEDRGRWVLLDAERRLPGGFVLATTELVSFRPGGWAANHRHDRTEIMLALDGDLVLVWRDHAGKRYETMMTPKDNKLLVFMVDSQVPHLVENRSLSAGGSLIAWANGTGTATILEGEESLRQN